MSLGADSFKIKVGEDYIEGVDRDNLTYTLGQSAATFPKSDAKLVSGLRRAEPDKEFIVEPVQ